MSSKCAFPASERNRAPPTWSGTASTHAWVSSAFVRLSSLRIFGLPPFGDVEIPFADESGAPRAMTILFGGGGVGKTTVLGAIANTRPSYAVTLSAPATQPPYVV